MLIPRKQLAEPYRLVSVEITPVVGQTRYPLPWSPCGVVSVFIGGLAMLPKNFSLSDSDLIVTEPLFFEGEVLLVTALV